MNWSLQMSGRARGECLREAFVHAVGMIWPLAAAFLLLPMVSPVDAKPADLFQFADRPGWGGQEVQESRDLSVPAPAQGRLITLGFGGDLGFSGKDQPLVTSGAIRHGRIIPWETLTSGLAPLLKVDATFANLETVITDDASLKPADRSFNFAASPEALFAAARAGINVLATANNHAADYGSAGILQTLLHLETARLHGLKAHAGLGVGRERYESDLFQIGGLPVALAAIGKGINPGGADGPGQPMQASAADFERVSLSLVETGAPVRVLSIHYGEELSSIVSKSDRQRLRSVVDRGRATIVFGHHSHVAAGIERRGDSLIFYGLGNLLHAGMQNMARYDACRDFGLFAKVHLWVEPGKAPLLRAVEVTPLTDMHEVTKPFPVAEARRRVALLNVLSTRLGAGGGQPLFFAATDAGSGLACMPGHSGFRDELEARCSALPSTPETIMHAGGVGADACDIKTIE